MYDFKNNYWIIKCFSYLVQIGCSGSSIQFSIYVQFMDNTQITYRLFVHEQIQHVLGSSGDNA